MSHKTHSKWSILGTSEKQRSSLEKQLQTEHLKFLMFLDYYSRSLQGECQATWLIVTENLYELVHYSTISDLGHVGDGSRKLNEIIAPF